MRSSQTPLLPKSLPRCRIGEGIQEWLVFSPPFRTLFPFPPLTHSESGILPAPPDSVHLASLHRAAVEQDPRARAIALQAAISELRLRNLSTQRLPQFTAGGLATYQSEVSSLPLPQGPELSKDHYQVTAEVNQLLYDGGMVAAQRALEEASRDVEQQRVRVEEHQLAEQVNDAYFGALLLQARLDQLDELRKDVQARLDAAEARVSAGTATPGQADALRAELVQIGQQQAEVRYNRGALLDVLHMLTGLELDDDTKLVIPDLEVPDTISIPHIRPEFALFALQREHVAQQARLSDARLRPRISAFAQGGYGRPGYDFLDDTLHPFWQGGVRVQWTPWDWRNTDREHETAALQAEVVTTQQEAFERGLRVSLEKDRNDIRRLREVIRADRELVRLREQIAEEAARQFDAGVMTGTDYVQRRNDAFQAELVERQHRIERVQKEVHYLTTLGRYPQ